MPGVGFSFLEFDVVSTGAWLMLGFAMYVPPDVEIVVASKFNYVPDNRGAGDGGIIGSEYKPLAFVQEDFGPATHETTNGTYTFDLRLVTETQSLGLNMSHEADMVANYGSSPICFSYEGQLFTSTQGPFYENLGNQIYGPQSILGDMFNVSPYEATVALAGFYRMKARRLEGHTGDFTLPTEDVSVKFGQQCMDPEMVSRLLGGEHISSLRMLLKRFEKGYITEQSSTDPPNVRPMYETITRYTNSHDLIRSSFCAERGSVLVNYHARVPYGVTSQGGLLGDYIRIGRGHIDTDLLSTTGGSEVYNITTEGYKIIKFPYYSEKRFHLTTGKDRGGQTIPTKIIDSSGTNKNILIVEEQSYGEDYSLLLFNGGVVIEDTL